MRGLLSGDQHWPAVNLCVAATRPFTNAVYLPAGERKEAIGARVETGRTQCCSVAPADGPSGGSLPKIRENAAKTRLCGGEEGIRTLDTALDRITV
jgi:hypothetical protein